MRTMKLFLQCQLGGFVFSVFLSVVLMALDSLTTATPSLALSFKEVILVFVSTQVLMFLAFMFSNGGE